MTSSWARRALAAGGHLADDVAVVLLAGDKRNDPLLNGSLQREMPTYTRMVYGSLAETLISEDPALD